MYVQYNLWHWLLCSWLLFYSFLCFSTVSYRYFCVNGKHYVPKFSTRTFVCNLLALHQHTKFVKKWVHVLRLFYSSFSVYGCIRFALSNLIWPVLILPTNLWFALWDGTHLHNTCVCVRWATTTTVDEVQMTWCDCKWVAQLLGTVLGGH